MTGSDKDGTTESKRALATRGTEVRPSRSGPRSAMYAQRVLNSDPFTRHSKTAAYSQQHTTSTTTPCRERGWAAAARARHAYTKTYILAARALHTQLVRPSQPARTGRGTRWQQCVTDRPAYKSRSPHRPIQLYLQGVFHRSQKPLTKYISY